MTALKGGAIKSFVRKPDLNVSLVLIYGPDQGQVSETVAKILAASGVDRDDPFSLVKMSGDALSAEPSLLADELATMPMFADRRVVWVKPTSKNIVSAVKNALEQAVPGNIALIEAGDLKPTHALRKAAEGHKAARALPCYADDLAGLAELISERVNEAGLIIASDAKALLQASLGLDRLLSQQEIDKLLLYVEGKDRIELEDVVAAVADSSQLSMDQLIDAVALGEVDQAAEAFQRLREDGTELGVLSGAVLRHFHLLSRLRSMADRGEALESALSSLRPPIFFKRRPLIERQVVRWSAAKLRRASELMAKVQAKTRLSPALAAPETERALLSLATAAKLTARR